MRTRLRRSEVTLAALLAAGLLAAGGATGATEDLSGAEGWQGLLGSRPLPELGGRWIVVLRAPSLADRVRAVGGRASELQMRVWTTAARDAQERAIARLAFRGVPVQPEQSYVRVLNGFAVSLDPRLLPALERDPAVQGVFPVRAAYPAAVPANGSILETDVFAAGSGRRPEIELPGFDGSGITVALLDTGVDTRHPFLQGRLLPGLDMVDPGSDAVRRAEPDPAGPAGAARDRDGRSRRRRPRAGRDPRRRARRVRASDQSRRVAARLGRRRLRVRPHGPGARGPRGRRRPERRRRRPRCGADRARRCRRAVRLVPRRAARRPRRTARSRSTRSSWRPPGTTVQRVPGFGSVAAPGGAPAALGVAAADSRRRSPTVHVLLRSGLRVFASGETPLGGAVPPTGVVTAPVAALPRRQVVAVTRGERARPPVRRRRVQPCRRNRGAASHRADDAGGGARARGRRRSRRPRRRPDPCRLARRRRAGRGADRRHSERDRLRGARGARGGRARRARRRRSRVRGEPRARARSHRSRAPASHWTAARGPHSRPRASAS